MTGGANVSTSSSSSEQKKMLLEAIGSATTTENYNHKRSIVSDAILHDNLRLFDSAWLYGSDPFLGRAIKTALQVQNEPQTPVRREELFVITKLAPANYLASAINSHELAHRGSEVHSCFFVGTCFHTTGDIFT